RRPRHPNMLRASSLGSKVSCWLGGTDTKDIGVPPVTTGCQRKKGWKRPAHPNTGDSCDTVSVFTETAEFLSLNIRPHRWFCHQPTMAADRQGVNSTASAYFWAVPAMWGTFGGGRRFVNRSPWCPRCQRFRRTVYGEGRAHRLGRGCGPYYRVGRSSLP